MNTCKDCKWFESFEELGIDGVEYGGFCHRYPPSHLVKEKKCEVYMFIDVYYKEWCGEFKKKENGHERKSC